MRTSIDVDAPLMDEALRLSGLPSKRAVVDAALREFVAKRARLDLRQLAGAVRFAGGYSHKALREGRGSAADGDREA